MSFIERVISLFAPQGCLSCGAERDRLLCDTCTYSLPGVPSRCYRCRTTTKASMTCPACRRRTPLRRVLVGTPYDGAAKGLLHAAKYERARSGLVEIGSFLSEAVRLGFDEDVLIVPVPTASGRVRQRGYDQAEEIARQIGLQTRFRPAKLLVRRTQEHQVCSNRA